MDFIAGGSEYRNKKRCVIGFSVDTGNAWRSEADIVMQYVYVAFYAAGLYSVTPRSVQPLD